MDKNEFLKLMRLAVSADANSPVAYSYDGENYSLEDVNNAVRVELNKLAGTYQAWRENKNLIFSLIEETLNDVLPARVIDRYADFAEIKTIGQGEKAIFTQRITEASKQRAKQFITAVGLAGTYETFRLDGKQVEVSTMAIGGAALITLEEMLDGTRTMADVLDIVMLGMDEYIYAEIGKALESAVTNMQAANKVSGASFDEAQMDKLLAVADAYGQASIYCTYEFAATMVPAEGWRSDAMRDARWNVGYLANYKGHRVVILPQSFEDDTNSKKVINPAFAWIIPSNAPKPVKIAFEGGTVARNFDNRDGSTEIQVYRKLGIAVMVANSICVYQNSALTR